jgi:hypothetical protein
MAGIAYALAKQALLDQCKDVMRSNSKYKENRASMFAWMHKRISTSARDHLVRDADAEKIILDGDDLLKLWQLMGRALVSTKIGSSVAMQEAALESYNALRQTKEMSITDFYKAFKARHKAVENVKCEAISEERKARQFNAMRK